MQRPKNVLHLSRVEIHESARRHGVSDEDASHAVKYSVTVVDLDPDSDPPKIFVVGPDRAGNVVEVIVPVLSDDEHVAIHAMPLRKK